MRNIKPFGITPNGEDVSLIQLSNGALSCEVLTLGATLRSLSVPDRNGNAVDVVLGYDTLEEYISQSGFFGATVGRFANRIAKGHFRLNGKDYTLAVNNGENHLHGGIQNFARRVWRIDHADATCATLSLFSPDGEEGYPGNVECSVTFALEENALVIRYRATTDQDTPCSLTNHSYFNLSGHDSGNVLQQNLQLFASHYTPINEKSIPLGTTEPVAGTPMDLRTLAPIGANIHAPFEQLQRTRGYDHNFVVDGEIGVLRPAAVAYSPDTGITMQAETTLPGLQLYTANSLPADRKGKGGCCYGPYAGFCLETQFFPDTPNQPGFPSATLKAGEEYQHCTVFRFTK